MQVFLFFRAYILEIMIVIFGMEMDATVNFFGTLRKFHDDNGSLFLHIFLYFFGGNDTGNDGQTFPWLAMWSPAQAPAAMKAGIPAMCCTGILSACSFSKI